MKRFREQDIPISSFPVLQFKENKSHKRLILPENGQVKKDGVNQKLISEPRG